VRLRNTRAESAGRLKAEAVMGFDILQLNCINIDLNATWLH
jgi:hypothetical protein